EGGHRAVERVLVGTCVADHEAAGPRLFERIPGKRRDAHAEPLRCCGDGLVVDAGREPDEYVDTRRDSLDGETWEMRLERSQQHVAAVAVDAPDAAHVAVVVAAHEEAPKRMLLEHRRADVEQVLDPLGIVRERRGDHHPAETESWRERP